MQPFTSSICLPASPTCKEEFLHNISFKSFPLSKYLQRYFLMQMLRNLKKKKKNEKLSRIHLHSLHDIFFPVGWTDADPWGCWEMTLIDGCCLRSQHTADSRNPTRVSSALWRAWSNKIIFLINLSSTSVAAMLGKINCLSVLSLSWICLCLFQLPREMHPCPSLYWKLEERF